MRLGGRTWPFVAGNHCHHRHRATTAPPPLLPPPTPPLPPTPLPVISANLICTTPPPNDRAPTVDVFRWCVNWLVVLFGPAFITFGQWRARSDLTFLVIVVVDVLTAWYYSVWWALAKSGREQSWMVVAFFVWVVVSIVTSISIVVYTFRDRSNRSNDGAYLLMTVSMCFNYDRHCLRFSIIGPATTRTTKPNLQHNHHHYHHHHHHHQRQRQRQR